MLWQRMQQRAAAVRRLAVLEKLNDDTVIFQGVKLKLTPMMEQYIGAKVAHPEAVLLFRMGDFYEVFFDDAHLLSRELGLTLTSRNKGESDEIPMAGVPHRTLEDYTLALVEKGYVVAVCDQLEDPQKAVGIVRRGVTQIITPGTLLDNRPGEDRKPRLLAAVAGGHKGGPEENMLGVASLDLATGDFAVTEVLGIASLAAEIARLGIREVLAPAAVAPLLTTALRNPTLHVRAIDDTHFDPRHFLRTVADATRLPSEVQSQSYYLAPERIKAFFQQVRDFSFRASQHTEEAVAALLWYCKETQRGVAGHILSLRPYRVADYMILDAATQANLEIHETLRGAKREGSLLGEIDETLTSAGARLLRTWLNYPLLQRARIEARLDAVAALHHDFDLREKIRDLLRQAQDLERLGGRLALAKATPRDLVALRRTLDLVPALLNALEGTTAQLLVELRAQLDPCDDVRQHIAEALVDEPPLQAQDGGVIKAGYHAELDKLAALARSGKDWLLDYERQQRDLTKIGSLKIKYSKVFGYFIEITRSNQHLAPDHYIRRQTLANCERYYTPELKEYEEEVLTADERRRALEVELFEDLRQRIVAQLARIRLTGQQLATLDVIAALAHLAHQRKYCRPQITDARRLHIEGGRHPVVERFMAPGERFIPNDLAMDAENARLLIITGPNMAGKSTVIRQSALLVLMAQAGSFVPADQAEIGLVDRIFSRVGASDNLALGQSTFMVEMTETAHILRHASERSLVILDEIGRGTSTFDGLSIAWAVAEHLHGQIAARVLFATHYHELTDLARTLSGVANYSVAVKEWQKEIIFLRKLVPGAANRSYGIQVGRLAGLPAAVLERAEEILYNLEMNSRDEHGRPTMALHAGNAELNPDSERATPHPLAQLALFARPTNKNTDNAAPSPQHQQCLRELETLSLDTTSPLQALNLLYKWQKRLKNR